MDLPEPDQKLLHAAQTGDVAAVQYLFNNEKSLNIDVQDSDGDTPLHLAITDGYEDIVQILLEHSANISMVNRAKSTPLHQASYWERIKVVQNLLKQKQKPNINAQDSDGDTALHLAIYKDCGEVVQILLEHDASVTIANNNIHTPLHLASSFEQAGVVQKLLKHKAKPDIDAQDSDGDTALHLALYKDCEEVVQVLLKFGAAVIIPNKDGSAPIESIIQDQKKIREAFIKGMEHRDVPFDFTNPKGLNPLHLAAAAGRDELVQFFFAKGADPNAQTNGDEKRTALDLAVMNRHSRVVKLFVDKLDLVNTSIDIERIFGLKKLQETDLRWAAENAETHSLVKVFLSNKEKRPKEIDEALPKSQKEGWSALELAVYHGEPALVWRLLRSSRDDKTAGGTRRRALAMAEHILGRLQKQGTAKKMAKEKGKSTAPGAERTKDGPQGAERVPDENEKYSQLVDMLGYPEMLFNPEIFQIPYGDKTYGSIPDSGETDAIVGSSRVTLLDTFKASIIDCYKREDRISFLRRSRDVRTVIYDEGPDAIMEKARKFMEQVRSEGEELYGYEEKSLRVRWIHLPANNVSK